MLESIRNRLAVRAALRQQRPDPPGEMWSRQRLLQLIIPLVIEQFLAVTIGMADTMMVSSCGEAAVSGISLVDTINLLLINIFSAFATGGAVVASQYIGKQEPHNACEAAKQLLVAVTVVSSAIGLIALLFKNQILSLVYGGIAADVMSNAQTYFLLSALSYPFLGIFNVGAALFRAMGNSKISMVTSILMNLINVTGNALLIFGFDMGVAGAGTASLVSRLVGALMITAMLCRNGQIIRIRPFLPYCFNWKMIRNILRIGVPNGLENSVFQLGKILVQGMVTGFGTAAIAANAVGSSLASFECIPGQAIGLAMVTVVGQCIGARDYQAVKKYTRKLLTMAYLSMIGLNLLLLLASKFVVGLYSLSEEAAGIALGILMLHGTCAMLIWPLSFTLPNALRAANDAKFTMIVSIASMFTFRIGFSYLLVTCTDFGVIGVWIAMIIDWAVRASFFVWRFARGKWKEKQYI